MNQLKSHIEDVLIANAKVGSAGVSIIELAGAEPQSFWMPDSAEEPLFLAYSITKTFSAALVLNLCEEGRLHLDDPLARWFPRIPRAEEISIRHLLSHTSGIPDYGGDQTYHDYLRLSPTQPWPSERFAAETLKKGLLFDPGQGWAYSNAGYMLVKFIIQEVAGMDFCEAMSERVFTALGLDRTFVPESVEDLASLAPAKSCTLSADRSQRDVRHHYHPGWVAHGVVASTPSEIVRFLDGLFCGRFLSRQSLEQMTNLTLVPEKFAPLAPWAQPSYGLGVMGDPASPWGMILGHNGGGPGYVASAFHASDKKGASVCVMGGIEENFDAEKVVFAVFDSLS